MNRSTPGLPVHHQLPEPTQTHVHWVGDAIQPSHPLSSPSPPALNLSQHQGLFKWVSSLHQVAKVLEFQLQHQSFQWTPRTDVLELNLEKNLLKSCPSMEEAILKSVSFLPQKHLSYCWLILGCPYGGVCMWGRRGLQWTMRGDPYSSRIQWLLSWRTGIVWDLGDCVNFLVPALWGFTFCLLPHPHGSISGGSDCLPTAVSCLNAVGTWPSQGYLYLGLILIINTIVFTQANTVTRNRNVHLTGGPAWRLNAFTGWRGKYLNLMTELCLECRIWL